MADKKPLTDEQQDLLMDYLLDKFMREKEFDQMRKEDRYNQPPKTDAVGKEIVSANMGGMISMDQMTAPLMMAEGGSPNQKLLDQIAKGGKNVSKMKVPTTRLDNNYRNTLLESGFEKKADSKDVKRGDAKKVGQKIGSFNSFNNYLKGKGLTLFSNDPRTMIKVTTELNKVRAGLNLPKYTNVGITTPRSLFEQKQTGTGYAERGSRIPKEKVEKVRLQAQLEADKKFGVTEKPTQKKLRFMAKFIQGKLGKKVTMASIMTMLTKSGFGKVLPGMSLLMPSEVEAATMYPEGVDPVKEIEMQEAQKRMNMNQGGIMDINKMTRPIMGYQEGTRNGTLVGDKENLEVREIIREADPEGIVQNVKSFFTKDRNLGTIKNPLPLDRLNASGVRKEELIESGAYITTPDGITFKATPFMFDKYLGTKYVENNTFGSRDDVEVEFIPKYITPGEKRFIDEMYNPTMDPRKNGTFTEMNQGGIMDINQLTRKIR